MSPFITPEAGLEGWLYASVCALPSAWATRAVEDIVARSVARNAALEVTGALLFTGTRFVQFIEGPTAGVEALRSGILADRRHRNIVTFLSGPRTKRLFHGWSLAYAGPSTFVADKVDALLPGDENNNYEILSLLEQFATRR